MKYYEVFIITTRPKRILAGKILEACEAYPNNEAFGYWAWEYRSLDAAIRKFEELESRSQNEEGQ